MYQSDWETKLEVLSQAMKESLRIGLMIISFTFREAVEDVEYKGRLNDHMFNSFTKGTTSNINTALLYLNLSPSKMLQYRGVVSPLRVRPSPTEGARGPEGRKWP